MASDDRLQSRRRFLGTSAGIAVVGSLAGCIGNGNGGEGGDGANEVRVPGIYDESGGTADVGRPTAIGSRDAITYFNENDELPREIAHPNNDYAYEVQQAQQLYDDYTSGDDPPVIVGWGTADTEALSGAVAEDEIVYISASYSANLLTEEAPYNFFGNLDYTNTEYT